MLKMPALGVLPSRHRRVSGFSLVEVLVAVLILAIGLLGLAGLQMAGLRYSGDAGLRSQAVLLAQDIIERMIANRPGVVNGATGYAPATSPTTFPTDCAADPCTSSDLATYDLVIWNRTLGTLLPLGSGSVTITGPDADSLYAATVTTRWTERKTEDSSDANKILTMTARI